MTAVTRQRSRVALVIAAYAAFVILANLAMANGLSAQLGAVLSLVPLALVLAWVARRSQRRGLVSLTVILVAVGAWLGWDSLQGHFPDLFFLEHATGNLVLAYVFGRTLAPNQEPLCTRFARIVHGGLPPKVGEYTRKVTLAWTLFFVAMFATSCALHFGAPVAAWSMFASVLTPILIATMFSVEYAIRSRLLPNVERVGLLAGIRAFSRHFAAASVEASR